MTRLAHKALAVMDRAAEAESAMAPGLPIAPLTGGRDEDGHLILVFEDAEENRALVREVMAATMAGMPLRAVGSGV